MPCNSGHDPPFQRCCGRAGRAPGQCQDAPSSSRDSSTPKMHLSKFMPMHDPISACTTPCKERLSSLFARGRYSQIVQIGALVLCIATRIFANDLSRFEQPLVTVADPPAVQM